MTTLVDRVKLRQISDNFSIACVSRLGGIAGLFGVALAVAQVLRLAPPVPAIEKVLQILPDLAVIVWLVGVYSFQSHRLGRLGSLGLGAATVGILSITTFNFLRGVAGVNSGDWVSTLLASSAMPLIYTVTVVFFVWGVLALGTSSLQTGMLPRGAVVLWMVGFVASLTSSWLPVSLVTVVGVLWSSVILVRGVPMKDVGLPPAAQPAVNAKVATVPAAGRLVPLDALRGVIMILMAIDHASIFVRRWHPFETWDQPLPDYPNLAAMLTRLATHPCAPGFFFLMGAGMVLFAHSRRLLGWSERKIASHLALRGLLFIALEQLIVDVASAGQVNPFDFSILAGLGAVMLFGILFLRLNGLIQAAFGVAILLLMQFLPGLLLGADMGIFSPIRLLILPGSVGIVFVLYPPLPWLGISLLGMAFARLLQRYRDKAYQVAGAVGLACLALFPFVRLLGDFGNLRMPLGNTLVDFFNVVKYPPSLSFLLLSLGFDLMVLYLFFKAASKFTMWSRPVVILGQAALYFFLVHWFMYAALGITPGGLPETYLAWMVGLILLYPVCKTFEAFKHTMPVTSVWRML
jgi:uncharacterized membrane protein